MLASYLAGRALADVVLPERLPVPPGKWLVECRVLSVAPLLLRPVGKVEDCPPACADDAWSSVARARRRRAYCASAVATSSWSGDAFGEDDGVLDRLGRALRLPGLHRMCRVAEERDAAERPVGERAPDEDRAAKQRLAPLHTLEQVRIPALEVSEELPLRGLGRPGLLRPFGVLHRRVHREHPPPESQYTTPWR